MSKIFLSAILACLCACNCSTDKPAPDGGPDEIPDTPVVVKKDVVAYVTTENGYSQFERSSFDFESRPVCPHIRSHMT